MKKYRLLKDLPGVKAGTMFSPDRCIEADTADFTIDLSNRDWFEEIKERWEPQMASNYYWLDEKMIVQKAKNFRTEWDKSLIGLGNCYRTEDIAKGASKHFKDALDGYHELIDE